MAFSKNSALAGLAGALLAGGVVAWPSVSGFVESNLASKSVEQPQGGEQVAADAKAGSRRAITALGRVEPAGRLVEVGARSDARIAEILVAEDDWVDAGQELFRLDSFAERTADRDVAAATLAVAKERLATEVELAEQLIRDSEAAHKRLVDLVPDEIEAQKARVKVLEIELENEKRSQRRETDLGDIVAGGTRDIRQAAVAAASSRLAAARADLRVRETRQQLDLADAKAAIARSKTMLQRAKLLFSPAEAESQLARAEARLEAARVRAPRSGRVLAILRDPGERVGIGAVLQLGNTREMHVVAEVYETDVAQVFVGQQAFVTSPAFADRIRGEVLRIGTMVAKNDVLDVDPLADTDTRVVEVQIRLLEGEAVSDLTNLEVDVDIELRGAATGEPKKK